MDKEAQIVDALQGAGSSIMDSLKEAPDNVSMFWDALSDNQKNTVINSLAGAAVGGLGSGLLGGDLSDSVVAALLGGAAGGGLTMGYNALLGGSKLPSEAQGGPGMIEEGLSAIGNPILANPGASIGGSLGAWLAAKHGGIPFTDAAHIEALSNWVRDNKNIDLPTKELLNAKDDIKAKALLGEIARASAGKSGADPAFAPKSWEDIFNTFKDTRAQEGTWEALKGVREQGLGRRGVIERATRGIVPNLPNRAAWLALPAGLVAGSIGDKYIQGEI
jgi:hypothetical protein